MTLLSIKILTMNNELVILVVDDEPDVVEILRYNLSKNHYRVVTASNGEDAVKEATEIHPDLIIMDIRMPGMSGIEACRKIRTDNSLSLTPILFLTADSDEYTTMNAFEAGANHFITKPIRPVILLEMIAELFRNKKSLV
jgi:two-component system alkaline phosphatase synthesis response regulator PhoP